MTLRHSLRLRSQWWAIVVLASLVVVFLTADSTLLRIDNAIYDQLLRISPEARTRPILLVEIDDESIQRLGRWPWSRSVHAALIDRLHQAGARAIAYDVLFTEPGDPQDDALLGQAIAGARPAFFPMLPPVVGPGGVVSVPVMPIEAVRSAASGIGFASVDPDPDGVVRSATTKIVPGPQPGTAPIHHLVALAAQAAKEREHAAFSADDGRPRRIPFRPGMGNWSEVSASAVLAGEVPPELLRDRIVLVGATASGLASHYPVPGGPVVSGLEIEASLLQGILGGAMIRPAGTMACLALALVPLWLLMVGLGPWRRLPALAMVGLAVATVLGSSALALMVWRLWLPPGAALAGLGLAYPLWGWRQLAVAEQFMRGQLEKLNLEPSLVPAMEPPLRIRGVASTIMLLQAAIARNREMRHFVADRLDQLPDATLVAGLDGRVVLANAAAHRLFAGLGAGIDPGAPIESLLPYFRRTCQGDAVPFPPAGIAPETHEVQTDQAHFFLLSVATQTAAMGGHAGWIIRLVDISEAKAAQRQRDDVVQLLTHDMRSPQASIVAVLETAPPERIHPVEAAAIRHYAEQTLRLADGFVQLARAENLDYMLEEIGLGDMLIDAVDDLWPQSRAKAIDIVTLGDEQMVVMGERSLLTRALVNVIGNAIKYSPEHTTITCTLTRQRGPDGSVRALCAIADQGAGIDAELHARMFERFHRGPVGLGPKTSGAGLGLSFVHTVMVRHHGTIACTSVLGKGTTFTLDLPIIG